MHNIVQRPVGVDGEIVLRPMMYLAVSYDHRIVDGFEAATLIQKIRVLLESPARLFM